MKTVDTKKLKNNDLFKNISAENMIGNLLPIIFSVSILVVPAKAEVDYY